MEKQLLKSKQLENLELGEDQRELHFKLMLDNLKENENLIIEMPNYSDFKITEVKFKESTIDKVSIQKFIHKKRESFIITIYLGKLDIATYYCPNDLNLYIYYDFRYRHFRIEVLEDWMVGAYSPVLLEIEAKK